MASTTGKFYNYITHQWTDDATEARGTRWFIKVGFAGYNTVPNNGAGFISQRRAETIIARYQTSASIPASER